MLLSSHYDMDNAIYALIRTDRDLQKKWYDYIKASYDDYHLERMVYVDIFEISLHIMDRYRSGKTDDFRVFFHKVEEVLRHCNEATEHMLVFGLLNNLQHFCKKYRFNCWTGFDKWLGPVTKRKWDYLLSF